MPPQKGNHTRIVKVAGLDDGQSCVHRSFDYFGLARSYRRISTRNSPRGAEQCS